MAESLVVIDPNITDLKTGTPVIKYGDSYIVAGIGGDFIPGGIGAKPQGVWDASVSYFRRDAVTYEGAFYVAVQDNIGVTPGTDNTKWLCYVKRGPEGPEGPEGPIGPEGSVFVPSVSSEGVISWTKKEGSEVTDTPESTNIRGPQGEPGKDGAISFEELTDEQKESLRGEQGYVFIPSISITGDLSWSNNGGLDNPSTINIKGDTGYLFTPSVSENGDLSWTNDGDLENPATVNIRGPKGDPGSVIEDNYIDISTVTDGYLIVSADTIPVSVEINNAVYPVLGMVKEGDTFKIPTANILATANLAEYSGTWRVWRAGGKQGVDGEPGINGGNFPIALVDALPENPDASTLYLIPVG